jgi:hypothetical protein
MKNDEIAFVIQGPFYIDKSGLTTNDLLKDIHKLFPESEIIFSTWFGIVEDVVFVKYILNKDPGEVDGEFLPIRNFKRLLISSSNGIKNATRPLVIKMRSDSLCVANTLPLFKAYFNYGCGEKILIAMHSTPIKAFMLDDKIQIGRRELMLEFWSKACISYIGSHEISTAHFLTKDCIYMSKSLQLAPEQILFLRYTKNKSSWNPNIKSNYELYKYYLVLLRDKFIFISAAKYGFGSLKWNYKNSLKLFLYLLLMNKLPIAISAFVLNIINRSRYKKYLK